MPEGDRVKVVIIWLIACLLEDYGESRKEVYDGQVFIPRDEIVLIEVDALLDH